MRTDAATCLRLGYLSRSWECWASFGSEIIMLTQSVLVRRVGTSTLVLWSGGLALAVVGGVGQSRREGCCCFYW